MRVPFSTRQMLGLASQPFSVLPSNMDVKPASLLAGTSGTIVLCDAPFSAACSAADNTIVAHKVILHLFIICPLECSFRLSTTDERRILVCQRLRRERDRHVIELVQCRVQAALQFGDKAGSVKNSLYCASIRVRLEAL